MVWKLKLYSISADGGESWTEQWLTEEEAQEIADKYGWIVKCKFGTHKEVYA